MNTEAMAVTLLILVILLSGEIALASKDSSSAQGNQQMLSVEEEGARQRFIGQLLETTDRVQTDCVRKSTTTLETDKAKYDAKLEDLLARRDALEYAKMLAEQGKFVRRLEAEHQARVQTCDEEAARMKANPEQQWKEQQDRIEAAARRRAEEEERRKLAAEEAAKRTQRAQQQEQEQKRAEAEDEARQAKEALAARAKEEQEQRELQARAAKIEQGRRALYLADLAKGMKPVKLAPGTKLCLFPAEVSHSFFLIEQMKAEKTYQVTGYDYFPRMGRHLATAQFEFALRKHPRFPNVFEAHVISPSTASEDPIALTECR